MILAFLDTMPNIYFGIAVGFTTFFALQSVLALVGNLLEGDSDFDEDVDIDIDEDFDMGVDEDFDMDVDEDFDIDEDSMILTSGRVTFHLLTFRTVIGFFMLFGWTGYFYSNDGINPWLVLIMAITAGFIMMFLIAVVIHYLYKLESTGTMNLSSTINKTGTVYFKIPHSGHGKGQVQIVVGDSLRTLDAIAYDTEIETGKEVRVVEVKNNVLVVEEIK